MCVPFHALCDSCLRRVVGLVEFPRCVRAAIADPIGVAVGLRHRSTGAQNEPRQQAAVMAQGGGDVADDISLFDRALAEYEAGQANLDHRLASALEALDADFNNLEALASEGKRQVLVGDRAPTRRNPR